MRSGYILLVLLGVLGMVAAGWGQPAMLYLCYLYGPPLGCPCDSAQPYADGAATVYLMRDAGPTQPDSLDPVYAMFPINGESNLGAVGYFCNQTGIDLSAEETGGSYYALVRGEGCRWRFGNFQVHAGQDELVLNSSTMTCGPDTPLTNPLTAFVRILAAQNSFTHPCTNGEPIPAEAPLVLLMDVNGNGSDTLDVPVDTVQFTLNSTVRFVIAAQDSAAPFYLLVDTLGVCNQSISFLPHVAPDCLILIGSQFSCVDHSCRVNPDAAQHRLTAVPTRTGLAAATPNPFNAQTSIRFTLANPEAVQLVIYNLSGQRIRTLSSGFFAVGEHAVVWNGTSDRGLPVGSGVYFCRLFTSQAVSTQRLLLLK